MAILEINGKDYEAKCTFKFERLAEKKYAEKDKSENELGGFMSVYMNLLQYSNKHLLAFWDCALEYLSKSDKPKIEDIEEALMKRIEEDDDTEKLFKEAFNAVDQSGFFKKQAKNFWKDFELMKDLGKTEEEKAENLKVYNALKEARSELTE
ncbi:tail assembly chaperone [Peribacillus frigoritolerans]|uniref:tail assembly chaperone n=1 Tax=Peribacillus frigoritolerans TaxID=450367 RepID=UPI002162D4F3|nr:tail assembly chaperone [Peribacillus frigoritolerans]